MPQIPVFSGRQILEPGNPTAPIAEGETAGAVMGRAQQQFGVAMFELGNELDRAARRAKEQMDKNKGWAILYAAKDEAEKERLRKESQPANPADPNDGVKRITDYKQHVDDFTNNLLDQSGADKKLRAWVWGELQSYRNERGTMVAADHVKKMEEVGMALARENVNVVFAQARTGIMAPDEAVVQIQKIYQDSAYVQDSEKVQKASESVAILGKEIVAGYTDKIWLAEDDASAQAIREQGKQAIVQQISGFFKPEDMSAEMKKIDDAYFAHHDWNWKMDRESRTKYEEAITDKDRSSKASLLGKLDAAGTDQAKINAVMAAAYQEVKQGTLQSSSLELILQQAKSFPKVQASDVSAQFEKALLTKYSNSPSAAIKYVDGLIKKKMIDNATAEDFYGRIGKLKDAIKQNPQFMAQVTAEANALEAEVRASRDGVSNSADPDYKEETDAMAKRASADFMKKIFQTGAQYSPTAIQQVGAQTRKEKGNNLTYTRVEGMAERDMDDTGKVQAAINDAKAKLSIEKDPTKRRAYVDTIKRLQANKAISTMRGNNKLGTPVEPPRPSVNGRGGEY